MAPQVPAGRTAPTAAAAALWTATTIGATAFMLPGVDIRQNPRARVLRGTSFVTRGQGSVVSTGDKGLAQSALAGTAFLAAATAVSKKVVAAQRRTVVAGRGASRTRLKANPIATFETSMGTFKAEILLEEMPVTASNFIDLANSGFYNGCHFHRVIPNFMAQFGCPFSIRPSGTNVGQGGPQDGSTFKILAGPNEGKQIARVNGKIPDEFAAKITNAPGTLSMANAAMPNTGGSQFFINVANNDFLDWWNTKTPSKHPVFGKVVEGFEVVEDISEAQTCDDRPLEPIRMESITIG